MSDDEVPGAGGGGGMRGVRGKECDLQRGRKDDDDGGADREGAAHPKK